MGFFFSEEVSLFLKGSSTAKYPCKFTFLKIYIINHVYGKNQSQGVNAIDKWYLKHVCISLLSDSYTHSLVDTQRKKQKNELKIKKAKNNVEAYKLLKWKENESWSNIKYKYEFLKTLLTEDGVLSISGAT